MKCPLCGMQDFQLKDYDHDNTEKESAWLYVVFYCNFCGTEMEGAFDLPADEFTITKNGMERGEP